MSQTRTAPPKDDREYLDGLPPCKHCGQDIHEHVADSDPAWMCHYEYQREPCYGYFSGGDPRDFHPDCEDSTPEEIANWKQACIEAERLQEKRELPCPSGWGRLADGTVFHMLRAPFGIGVCTYPPTFYEPSMPSDERQSP